jgi:TolB-like protein/tetratricopeptide (TPR) repeat protein
MGLLTELKRRNVIRVGALYLVAGWLVIQISDVVFPALGVPDFGLRFIIGFLIVCFPLALIFSWVYEMTPEGIKKERDIDRSHSITPETGHKINALIIVLLVLAIVAVIADRMIPEPPTVATTLAQEDSQRGGEIQRDQATEPAESADEMPRNTAPEKSVAVLPFVNMSNDPDNEFFSDGLSEELLNVLARMPGLFVAARTSSFYFKGHTGDISDIARQLRVRNVLEGSVRKAGNRVRVTAQLIDATNGYHLWSDTFDRQIEDVFAVQDEIARHVAEALKVALLSEDVTEPTVDKPTENMNAYLAFLRGQQHLNAGGVDGYAQAVIDFEEAVKEDPSFAEAYASLGLAWAGQADWGNITYKDVGAKIRTAADKALALNRDLALAWTTDGLAYAYSGPDVSDDPRVLASIERARSLDPDSTRILYWYSNALGWADRSEESIEPLQQGLQRDPLSAILHSELAGAQVQQGDFDRARQSYLTAARLAPSDPRPPDGIAGIERNMGEFGDAIRSQARVIELDPGDTFSRSLITIDYLEFRDYVKAREWATVAARMDPDAPMSRASVALTEWFGGDKARAAEEAEDYFDDALGVTTGSPQFWMRVIALNSWMSQGDVDSTASFLKDNFPEMPPPTPGESISGTEWPARIEAISIVRARDGDGAANELVAEWLRWADAGVDDMTEGEVSSIRCLLLASLGRFDDAISECRKSLRTNANGAITWWQITPLIDPIRDTPQWRSFMEEVQADRARQLAALRASGEEPAPH